MFEYWIDVDLLRLPDLPALDTVFSQDSGANKIGVRVTRGGVPVTLTGSIRAWVVKPNDTTITVDGSLSGNAAWVVLPSGAYDQIGQIGIFIKNIVGTQVTTLAGVKAYVYKSR